MTRRELHMVVPDTIDDPRRVSGGNVYDRRLILALRRRGWTVHELPATVGDTASLRTVLTRTPDDALVVVDGLIAGRASGEIEAAAARVRVAILAHMVAAALPSEGSAAVDGERRATAAARVVIATSPWTRAELVRRGLADAARIRVAVPGSDEAEPSAGTAGGRALLNVGVVAPHKGQDVLVAALGGLRDLDGWTCTIAGSRETSAAFASAVAASTADERLEDRVHLPGVLTAGALSAAYHAADLVVAPSRAESYGMTVTEALRRGIPVVASATGGIPDAVAAAPDAVLLVPPGDPRALGLALRRWMTEPGLRERLRARALEATDRMPSWDDTAAAVSAVLAGMP